MDVSDIEKNDNILKLPGGRILNLDRVEYDGDERELIDCGLQAMERFRRAKQLRQTLWEDWTWIGSAITTIRDRLVEELGIDSTRFNDRGYSKAMSAALQREGFGEIDRTTRMYLCKIIDDIDEVEDWRETVLDEKKRSRLNNPMSVWKAFKKWREGDDADEEAPTPEEPPKTLTESVVDLQTKLDEANQLIESMRRGEVPRLKEARNRYQKSLERSRRLLNAAREERDHWRKRATIAEEYMDVSGATFRKMLKVLERQTFEPLELLSFF
jgi:ElaB/YqjD/DUF883 family membrane-anchored ribosome-binding protein